MERWISQSNAAMMEMDEMVDADVAKRRWMDTKRRMDDKEKDESRSVGPRGYQEDGRWVRQMSQSNQIGLTKREREMVGGEDGPRERWQIDE